jgi:catechol 2,3-dioxygenase-like lactoylglutathione lyase family enzyme
MEFRLSKYVAIDTKDYERAIAFYRNVLGWQVIEETTNETQFKKGDATFFIANDAGSAYTTYFEYEVDDIEVAVNLLKTEGCALWPSGKPQSYMVKDPYGTHFHVYQKGAL